MVDSSSFLGSSMVIGIIVAVSLMKNRFSLTFEKDVKPEWNYPKWSLNQPINCSITIKSNLQSGFAVTIATFIWPSSLSSSYYQTSSSSPSYSAITMDSKPLHVLLHAT